MNLSPAEAVLSSWSFPPAATSLNILSALLYLRGWLSLRALIPNRFSTRHLLYFFGGLASLEIALASPIDAFDAFFLTDHMTQHLFLMMIVPPLFLLSNPAIPIMRGLPRRLRRVLGSLLNWNPIDWILRIRTHPGLCWFAFIVTIIGWHLPEPYDLALRSSSWHGIEHLSFLTTSILFWWPVIQPWPSRAYWPRWSMIPYLLLADFANSGLSAFLVFSGRVLYPFYFGMPRLGGVSVQNDQVVAGAFMWIVGSVAFLIPAVVIAHRLLAPQSPHSAPFTAPARGGRPPQIVTLPFALGALTCILPLAALAFGLYSTDSIDIDGDIVRAQSVSGSMIVTVFTAPDPLRAGPTDVAVLVQDSSSGAPILNAAVRASTSPVGHSAVAPGEAPIVAATNKLLSAATIDIPSPGDWDLQISIERAGEHHLLHSTVNVLPAK